MTERNKVTLIRGAECPTVYALVDGQFQEVLLLDYGDICLTRLGETSQWTATIRAYDGELDWTWVPGRFDSPSKALVATRLEIWNMLPEAPWVPKPPPAEITPRFDIDVPALSSAVERRLRSLPGWRGRSSAELEALHLGATTFRDALISELVDKGGLVDE